MLHKLAVFWWVGELACNLATCQPFWSRATLHRSFTKTSHPPSRMYRQRCTVDKWVQLEACLQFSSFKQMSSHRVGGWEGLNCKVCARSSSRFRSLAPSMLLLSQNFPLFGCLTPVAGCVFARVPWLHDVAKKLRLSHIIEHPWKGPISSSRRT